MNKFCMHCTSSFLLLVLFFGANGDLYALDERAILIDGPEVDLTVGDMQKLLLSVPSEIRPALLANQVKLREAINSTYLTKVAAYRARMKGLDREPEVQAAIWNRTMNILADAELQRVVDEALAKDEDFEKAAYEEYLANKENYKLPAQVEVSHILFRIEKGDDESAVLEEAKRIRSDILSGRLSFAEAAKKYSKDPGSAEKGGSLGLLSKGQMIKPFEQAAFEQKIGEVGEPVRSRFGYHLILVKSRSPASVRPFEEVKQSIIEKLKKKMATRIREDYWFRLEGDERIQVHKDMIDEFVKQQTISPSD